MSFVLIQSPWPQIFSVWPEPDHNSHRTSLFPFPFLNFFSFFHREYFPSFFFYRRYDLSIFRIDRFISNIYIYICRRKIRSIRALRKELLHIQTESVVRGRVCLKVNPYPATALKRIIRDKLREE